jgi:hypothetical protein
VALREAGTLEQLACGFVYGRHGDRTFVATLQLRKNFRRVRLAADGTARVHRYPCEMGEPGNESRDELDDWLEVFHADSLTLAAAAVLASRGTLREAAYRLHDAGFAPPADYFDAEELAEIREDGRPEEGLRRWVRRERNAITRAAGRRNFWRETRIG